MWKKLINYAIVIAAFTTATSCKEMGDNTPAQREMQKIVNERYPTVNRFTVEIIEHSDVIITLGDAELYNGPEAERQRVTNELGDLTVQLFEKNNYLDEGTVIFAKEENSLNVKEDEIKKYDMDLKKRLSVGK
jgi:hypothetical protein